MNFLNIGDRLSPWFFLISKFRFNYCFGLLTCKIVTNQTSGHIISVFTRFSRIMAMQLELEFGQIIIYLVSESSMFLQSM